MKLTRVVASSSLQLACHAFRRVSWILMVGSRYEFDARTTLSSHACRLRYVVCAHWSTILVMLSLITTRSSSLHTITGVAYARTVAGVHYASDNIAGLTLGCKLIADYLPAYLEEMYGSDPNAVRAKIDQVKVDWSTFLDSDCYKSHMT